MLIYGILRNDFAILLGQFIVYFIYIRNIQLKGAWKSVNILLRALILMIPVTIIILLAYSDSYNLNNIINNEDVGLILMIFGSTAQIIFTFRFIYQWIYSENQKDSVLPLGFWIISTVGSLMILTYAILRLDPVLIFAHCIGFFIYIRNIFLHYGRKGLFVRFKNIPVISRLMGKVSDKIK
jgi:lipid-A-disaccharide synthase-like uncharacterized protein